MSIVLNKDTNAKCSDSGLLENTVEGGPLLQLSLVYRRECKRSKRYQTALTLVAFLYLS